MIALKIAITGATGSIGVEITNLALTQGHSVLAIVNPNSTRSSNLTPHPKLKIIKCSISRYRDLFKIEQCDVFIHLAWCKTTGAERDDVQIQSLNIGYALDAVHLAKSWGAKVFIGAGSQAEYGICSVDLSPSTPINPQSGYGIAKYASGRLCGILCDQLGIHFNWVRILSVFGSNDKDSTLINYLISSFKSNIPPELTECNQIWDYLYAKDAAKAIMLICEKGKDRSTYVLGSGTKRSLREYVQSIKKITGSKVEPKFGAKSYYPHQPMYLCADITALSSDVGFNPEYTFEEGIIDIVENKNQKCRFKNV